MSTVASLQTELETLRADVSRYVHALHRITEVLAPGPCDNCTCRGCRKEMEDVYRIAMQATGQESSSRPPEEIELLRAIYVLSNNYTHGK